MTLRIVDHPHARCPATAAVGSAVRTVSSLEADVRPSVIPAPAGIQSPLPLRERAGDGHRCAAGAAPAPTPASARLASMLLPALRATLRDADDAKLLAAINDHLRRYASEANPATPPQHRRWHQSYDALHSAALALLLVERSGGVL